MLHALRLRREAYLNKARQKSRLPRQTFCISLLMATVLAAHTTQADVTIIPTLAYQDKQLTFDQKYGGGASNSAEFSVHLPMINAGVTVAWDKFFVALKAEQNLSATATTTNETDRSTLNEANLIAVGGSNVQVDREDITFTLGYNVWRTLNLFVGYIDGKTELEPQAFCVDAGFPEDPNAPIYNPTCTRSNRAFLQHYLDLIGITENTRYVQTYSETGFYLGASQAFAIKNYGTLSINVAYASMDGEYKDTVVNPDNVFPGFLPFNYEGDSTGTSLGMTWTGSLGDNAAYFFDIKRQAYSMDGRDTTGNYSTVTLETDETMTGLTAGVQLYF